MKYNRFQNNLNYRIKGELGVQLNPSAWGYNGQVTRIVGTVLSKSLWADLWYKDVENVYVPILVQIKKQAFKGVGK